MNGISASLSAGLGAGSALKASSCAFCGVLREKRSLVRRWARRSSSPSASTCYEQPGAGNSAVPFPWEPPASTEQLTHAPGPAAQLPEAPWASPQLLSIPSPPLLSLRGSGRGIQWCWRAQRPLPEHSTSSLHPAPGRSPARPPVPACSNSTDVIEIIHWHPALLRG